MEVDLVKGLQGAVKEDRLVDAGVRHVTDHVVEGNGPGKLIGMIGFQVGPRLIVVERAEHAG